MVKARNPRGRRRNYEHNIAAIRKRNAEYVATLADPKHRLSSTRTATTDKSTVQNYLQRPVDNSDSIAANLRQAYINSGVINKVVDYYVSQPLYNYSISPVLGNKIYSTDSSMHDAYIDVAYGLDELNIKFYAPYFFKETLIEGVSYFYKVEDANGVGYIKFPTDWCRISSMDQGVYRFRLDMSKIKQEIVDTLPQEIQKAREDYSNGNTADENQWYNNRWFNISDAGVAFTFDPNSLINGGVAISPFAGILVDSLSLDKAKENISIKDQLDTVRLIHAKIPTDNNGEATMPLKISKIFFDQMKSRLPDGVVGVTSPMNLSNIPLNGSGTSGSFDTVDKTLDQLFFDLGTSAPLFGGPTTSANIVRESVKKDANWIYTNLFPLLENYYNYEITKIKTKSKAKWEIKFIHESNFSLKDDIALLKDQLSYGGSRLDYLAACGFSPIEIISKLEFEQQVLDIDDIMVVKPTSNTISAKGASQSTGRSQGVTDPKNSFNPNPGQVGRPKTDNPTDDTDRLDGGEM